MYIIIAILIFGILIAVHELGHFLAAKSVGVKVNEFSIGMGPGIFKKQGKETLYSLRLLPIGGYCAIEGENDDSEDERSMGKKPLIARLLILFAGSFMNFIAGFLIVLVIVSFSPYYSTTRLDGFMPDFPLQGEEGLMVGDRIVSIDGHSVHLISDFSLHMDRREDAETVDMVVIRDGKRVRLDDLPLVLREYEENGEKTLKYGLFFSVEPRTFFGVFQQAWYNSVYFVKMVWMGLGDIITGRAALSQMSGVVGAVAAIGEVGAQSATVLDGIINVFYLGAFIAVNLSVMNLLPIPGLDGGHILTMVVVAAITKLTGRKPNPKVEAYIHGAGLVLLLALMAVLLVSDVAKLI
ncbi:MAG: site-2 protease family protein [Oscillospiraceae bacterium]|nr:site-2 protease family protein [Oscillospiraceae bacterium]